MTVRLSNGRVVAQDWPSVLKALRAAYGDLGLELEKNVPDAEWNLAAAVIEKYNEQNLRHCCNCDKVIYPGDDIRCLDCRAVFCPHCAKQHFWPNGRPKEGSC